MFFILLIIIIIILFYLIFHKYESYKNYIDYHKIPIYIIHQKKKVDRWNRLKKLLLENFPNNPIYIIEPISTEYLKNNILKLLQDNIISKKAYNDILNIKNPIQGTLTLASLSLYLTNMYIYEKDINQPFLILEDDTIFRENFIENFKKILLNLHKDWDIVYLSCHFICDSKHVKSNLMKIKSRIHGMGAVLYHPKCIPIILKHIYPFDLQIDHDIPDKLILKSKINAYVSCNKNNETIIFNDNINGSSTQL